MSEPSDKRSDTTRDQILRAAAHQFAQRPYYAVGLDDILARSAIDQGRNVFPFPIEARAGVGHRRRADRESRRVPRFKNLLARRLSGLETLIDVSYLIAVGDITHRCHPSVIQSARVGRPDREAAGAATRGLDPSSWARSPSEASSRATSSNKRSRRRRTPLGIHLHGDASGQQSGRTGAVAHDFEKALSTVLRGIVQPDRIGYFAQFVKRRTAWRSRPCPRRTRAAERRCEKLTLVKPQLLGQILERRERNIVIGAYQRRFAHQRPHTRAILMGQFDDHVRQRLDDGDGVGFRWWARAGRPDRTQRQHFVWSPPDHLGETPSLRTPRRRLCAIASTGTGIRSSTTRAGSCLRIVIGDWPGWWPLRLRSTS